MSINIDQSIEKINQEVGAFQQFVRSRDLVILASAVCIGFATKDLVEKLMAKVVAPLLQVATKTSILLAIIDRLQTRLPKPIYRVLLVARDIGWDILLWIAILLVVFLLMQRVLVFAVGSTEKKFIDTQPIRKFVSEVMSEAARRPDADADAAPAPPPPPPFLPGL